MKKRFLSTGILFMVLVAMLAALGVGYAHWTKVLNIDGTVTTGTLDAVFDIAFTDDDDVPDNPAKDLGDDDDCADLGGVDADGDGLTSCDPSAPGPNPPRYDKDVARCDVVIDPLDPQILHITIDNGYPSYWCTVWYDILNTGSVPVKIQHLTMGAVPAELAVSWSGLACGQQIDPGYTQQGDVNIHVEQPALENTSYAFDMSVELVNWNEYDPALCP